MLDDGFAIVEVPISDNESILPFLLELGIGRLGESRAVGTKSVMTVYYPWSRVTAKEGIYLKIRGRWFRTLDTPEPRAGWVRQTDLE